MRSSLLPHDRLSSERLSSDRLASAFGAEPLSRTRPCRTTRPTRNPHVAAAPRGDALLGLGGQRRAPHDEEVKRVGPREALHDKPGLT
jgi:hypothetical protein